MSQIIKTKDKEILYELSKDSSRSLSQLAHILKISKQNINYRINNLIKRGIIKQFYSLINFTALGYKPYKIFLRLDNPDKKNLQSFIEEMSKYEYVVWVVNCEGKYDIILGIIAKNSSHFKEIYLSIFEKYKNIITYADHSTMISAHQKNKSYLSEKRKETRINNFYVDKEVLKIDKIDSKILSLLSKDSKTSLVNIAEKLTLTGEAIRVRVKNLEKKNIISGYSIIIDSKKLNYQSYKILFNLRNVSKEEREEFIIFLRANRKILEVIDVFGKWDLEIDFEAEGILEFHDILSEIRTKFKHLILTYETLIKYEEYSYNYYPIK